MADADPEAATLLTFAFQRSPFVRSCGAPGSLTAPTTGGTPAKRSFSAALALHKGDFLLH
jgi:hypothetical protein